MTTIAVALVARWERSNELMDKPVKRNESRKLRVITFTIAILEKLTLLKDTKNYFALWGYQ